MRRIRLVAAGAALCAVLGISMPGVARAGSCETLVCMSGMVGNGSPAGGCGSPISKYFSIIRFNFWGYDAGRTYAARQRYLMECPGAAMNIQWVSLIQAIYGTVP